MNVWRIFDTRAEAVAAAQRFPAGPPEMDLTGIDVHWFIAPLNDGWFLAWSFEAWENVNAGGAH